MAGEKDQWAQEIAALVAERKEGGWGRSLHDMLIIAQRNILIDIRNPAAVLVSTAFSISLLFVFTASFAKVVSPDESFGAYAQFLLPFTLIQGLLFNTINVGVSFYNDLSSGRDTRMRSMPISRLAAVGGRLLASGARLLFQISGIVLAGHLIGFRLQGGVMGVIGFFLLPILFTLSVGLIALYVAVGAKSAEAISAVLNPWILPFTFMSVGYVPKEGFPKWAQGFVSHNPVSTIAQAMRALATGEPASHFVITTLCWSALLISSFGALTLKAYKRRI
ncbi:MAG: ABC transporter permease [Phormidesmis sp.]